MTIIDLQDVILGTMVLCVVGRLRMTRVRLFLAILALVLSTNSIAWADHPSDQRRLQELVEALPVLRK